MTHTERLDADRLEFAIKSHASRYAIIRKSQPAPLLALLYREYASALDQRVLRTFAKELATADYHPVVTPDELALLTEDYDQVMLYLSLMLLGNEVEQSETESHLLPFLLKGCTGKSVFCLNPLEHFEVTSLLDSGFHGAVGCSNDYQAAAFAIIADLLEWELDVFFPFESTENQYDVIYYRESVGQDSAPQLIRHLIDNNLKSTGQMIIWTCDGNRSKMVGNQWQQLRQYIIEQSWLDFAIDLPNDTEEYVVRYDQYSIWRINKCGIKDTTYYDLTNAVDFSNPDFYGYDADKYLHLVQSTFVRSFQIGKQFFADHQYRIIPPLRKMASNYELSNCMVRLGDVVNQAPSAVDDNVPRHVLVSEFYKHFSEIAYETSSELTIPKNRPWSYLTKSAWGVLFVGDGIRVTHTKMQQQRIYINDNALFFELKPEFVNKMDPRYILWWLGTLECWTKRNFCYSIESGNKVWYWQDIQDIYIPLIPLENQQQLLELKTKDEHDRVKRSILRQLSQTSDSKAILYSVEEDLSERLGSFKGAAIYIAKYRDKKDGNAKYKKGNYGIYIMKTNGEQVPVLMNLISPRLMYMFFALHANDFYSRARLKDPDVIKDFYALYNTLFAPDKYLSEEKENVVAALRPILTHYIKKGGKLVRSENFDNVKSNAQSYILAAVDSPNEAKPFVIQSEKRQYGIRCNVVLSNEFKADLEYWRNAYDSDPDKSYFESEFVD